VWLAECGSMPRTAVTDLIARGAGVGLPALATTTTARAAAELAQLTNAVVVHRMTDAATARHLPTDAGHLSALHDGEFVLAVNNPRRLVPRAFLVRARISPAARPGRIAAAGQRARERA
jgi:hypothetical protein